MNDKYALGLLGQGYQNSGGWRFGGKTSGDFLQNAYTPEAYNQALLDLVGNKKGAVDQALSTRPVDNVINTGLLQGNEGRGDLGNVGPNASQSSNPDHMSLGINGMGFGINSSAALSGAVKGAAAGPLGMAIGGLLGGAYADPLGGFAQAAINAQEARDAANAAISATNGYGQLGNDGLGVASPATGPGTIGVRDSYGSNESGPSSAGMGGASEGSAGSTAGGGADGPDGPDGNNAGWAMGGMVKKGMLSGPNPAGPDDGYGKLKNGEYVIKASAVKKYGKGLLGEINSGKFKR